MTNIDMSRNYLIKHRIFSLLLVLSIGFSSLPLGQVSLARLIHHDEVAVSTHIPPCPHTQTTQIQCQAKQASLFSQFEDLLLMTDQRLFCVLLFVSAFFAYRKAAIKPLDKPPKIHLIGSYK